MGWLQETSCSLLATVFNIKLNEMCTEINIK